MKKRVYDTIPHILFVVLSALIITPSETEVDSFWPFLIVVIAIEIALICNRKKKAANDIVIIVNAFLIIWEIYSSKLGGNSSVLFPAPEDVFMNFVTDYPKILSGIVSSLCLMLESFVIALVLGVGLGFVVGISDRLTEFIIPIARVLSPIPAIVYSPYAVRLLPSFRAASVFIITLSLFWGLFMNMAMSVRQIDKKIMDSARTLNISRRTLIVNILLPYSVPGILNSLTVSVSTSFLVLTAAEMLGGTKGMGWYIKYHSDFADYTKVVAGIITIGIVVTLINILLKALRKILVKWK